MPWSGGLSADTRCALGTGPCMHRPPVLHALTLHSRRGVITHAESSKGRQPWDLGRFVRTVLFFNPPPSPDKVLQGMLQPFQSATQGKAGSVITPVSLAVTSTPPGVTAVPIDGIIMVTGATGGVGRRVVQRLLAAGKHVRALVRDVEKAKRMLSQLPVMAGGRLELVGADVTQRATLLPEMFDGVRAVVCCTAVKVVPKEGDPDRSKYFQGIKFYDPTIQGDTPEAVESKGMQNLLAAVKDRLGTAGGRVMLSSDGQSTWGALDDVVMGGVSRSAIQLVQRAGENGAAAMVFSGYVSTDNSGGFASVRARNFEPPLNLTPYEGVELRVLGDGQRYKLILRADANWDGIAYCHSFDTKAGEWQTVRVPFKEFIPVFRAKTLKDGQPFNPTALSSVQLMLSKFEYDGQLNPAFRKGEFSLPISYISTYLPEPVSPRFVHVSSAGVTRPNRPGIDVGQEPPAVRMNVELGGILTYKLAGEDALRSSGVPHVVVRPCALTEEPGGMPVRLDQGDTIKGKISREDIADLCVALLSQPAATNTTFEITSTVPFSQPWTGASGQASAPRDWSAELSKAGLRPGVTGKTVDGVYTGNQPEAQARERVKV